MRLDVFTIAALSGDRPGVEVCAAGDPSIHAPGTTSSTARGAAADDAAGSGPDRGDEGSAMRASDAAPAVFERVYDEHFAFVWRTLRLLGVAEGALEDAAQDVFAVVSHKLPSFAGRSSLRTWIFAIVQRTASNHRRSHRRKQKPLVPLSDAFVSHEPTPQAHAEALDAARAIERHCETLDAERRALLVLALIEEVPAAEIARALGVPTNTIYSRVRLLRAGLERALEQSEQEHG
jgi:RNA polymerase sigma-70 factor, ECF subfamily